MAFHGHVRDVNAKGIRDLLKPDTIVSTIVSTMSSPPKPAGDSSGACGDSGAPGVCGSHGVATGFTCPVYVPGLFDHESAHRSQVAHGMST